MPDTLENALSPEDEALILEEALLVADGARNDPAVFFEAALVEERMRTPIKVAPHQRLLMHFVLAHKFCVVMMPAGSSKTFTTGGLALWLLGRDPTMRGVIVSATQAQSAKPLKMVRENIEENAALHWVFPRLRRSSNKADPWTQTSITVERPYGIRDPSLSAIGYNGALPGARLNFVMVDDILDQENVSTPEYRTKVYDWLTTTVRSRLDVSSMNTDARIIALNTAWHPDDAVHRLIKDGWPALIMRIDGQIEIHNTDWDSDDLRADTRWPGVGGTDRASVLRLAAFDPDPHYQKSIWPAYYTPEVVEEKRAESGNPAAFNRMYMNLCRDDSTSLCKQEFVDACLATARRVGAFGFERDFKGTGTRSSFTGVDLAFGVEDKHDQTAFFTFFPREDGVNIILDIEVGRWDVPTVIDKIIDKAERFNSIVCVESNVGQRAIADAVLMKNRSLPIKSHQTGREKAHPQDGIPGIFMEMSNGAWAFPNGPTGATTRAVKMLVDACLYYEPTRHVDDVLMAFFLARMQARKWGMMGVSRGDGGAGQGGIGMQIMSR